MHEHRLTVVITAVYLLLVTSAVAVPIAAQPKTPAHPIVGIWTNPAYNGEGRSARVVYQPDGKGGFIYTAYDNADGSGAAYKGKAVYKKTWKDKKGFRYGLSTVTLDQFGMSWETLDRISPDGKTMWLLYSGLDCDLYSFCLKKATLDLVLKQ